MLKKTMQNTIWIFNHPNPELIPSYYVSGLMPAEYMGIKKIVFLDNHNPEKLINHFQPKIIILSKAFSTKVSELTEIAKRKNIKIISIFDDWSFENTNRTKPNLPIAENSDVIIAKTKFAANEIYTNTNLNCLVIPDPIRFKKSKIFEKIDEPIKVCWFGMHTNHSTIISELLNIEKINVKINLSLISNSFETIENFINQNKFKNLSLKLLLWNKNSDLDIVKSDVVILPYPNDKKRLIKSSNRIIESLNLGRFTILSNVKQFSEFEKFTYFGDISKGLHWLLNNNSKAKQITLDGQRYVNDNYSIRNICDKWLKVFQNLKT